MTSIDARILEVRLFSSLSNACLDATVRTRTILRLYGASYVLFDVFHTFIDTSLLLYECNVLIDGSNTLNNGCNVLVEASAR